MFEIIYDVKTINVKLYKKFTELGIPLNLDYFTDRDLRCVGIATDKKYLNKAKKILNKANVENVIKLEPVELDWLPSIYYISVLQNDMLRAQALLENIKIKKLDIAEYLEGASRANIRTERLLIMLAGIFMVGLAIFFALLTVSIAALKIHWVVTAILILWTLCLMAVSIFSFREWRIRKK